MHQAQHVPCQTDSMTNLPISCMQKIFARTHFTKGKVQHVSYIIYVCYPWLSCAKCIRNAIALSGGVFNAKDARVHFEESVWI